MEETDLTVDEGAMDVCVTESEGNKQDGILHLITLTMLYV